VADLSPASFLANPTALAAAALIVPIILLYLLKPKPKLVMFPSTMFIRFMEKNKRFSSFLQRFIHDPLLLMQVLIIVLLAVAIANPFYHTKQEVREEEAIVMVVDASASMQASDAAPSRFQAAIDKARSLTSNFNKDDEVSVILAENIPAVVSSRQTPEAAAVTLGNLKAADTPSNIGDAMMLAKDMLVSSDRKRVIYVLSDFAGSGGLDPQLARKVSMASGINVELLKVGSQGENAGIVSLDAKRSSVKETELYLTASVRNFRQEPLKAQVRIMAADKAVDQQEKTIAAGGEGFYYFRPNVSSDGQVIRAELVGEDELAVDDKAYAYIPPVKVSRVLLLTSTGSEYYLARMLEAIRNVEQPVTVVADKFLDRDVSGFDVIIIGNVKSSYITPDISRDIKNHVHNGASLIVLGTDNLKSVEDSADAADLWSIMPVNITVLEGRETAARVVEDHDMLQDVVFDGVILKKYYAVSERDNSTKTILGAEALQTPLIAYRQYGSGHVVYVGVNSDPAWSSFYYSSSFPIFWSQMLKYVTKNRGVDSVSAYKTGDYLQLERDTPVKTPSGVFLNSSSIFLDKAGVYTAYEPDRQQPVAVNLLDSVESNTTGMIGELKGAQDFQIKRQEVELKVEVFRYLLGAMLALLVLELILYRRRGVL
jgi:hypothetical protein